MSKESVLADKTSLVVTQVTIFISIAAFSAVESWVFPEVTIFAVALNLYFFLFFLILMR